MSEGNGQGYTKATRVSTIEVVLTFPKLYPGVKFTFPLPRTTKSQKNRADQAAATDKKRTNVDWLAELLIARPSPFPDLPDTGNLVEDVRAYFSDPETPELGEMADAVSTLYYDTILPSEFLERL